MGMVISGDVFQSKMYNLIGDIEGVKHILTIYYALERVPLQIT